MITRIFPKVWYLPYENRWCDLNILAFKDAGKLTVGENSVDFDGSKETVLITNIYVSHSGSKAETS